MKKFFKILTLGILTMGVLAGCGSTSDSSQAVINLNGSTSMEKLSNSLAEVYMQNNPSITVTPQFTGSSAGIESVINGSADIGNSSRYLKDSELASGIVENVVAMDVIVVVVDQENPVIDLSEEQLRGIFNGTITNWSEVGGNDMGIVVIGREAGSGTRSAFEEILGIEDEVAYVQEVDSTGAVVGKVASTIGAIGYVSSDVVENSGLSVLNINGQEPTTENVINDIYPLYRPFIMATKGEISEQRQEVQDFFEFIQGPEGAEIIEKVGLVNIQ